mmetsp:Transcript_1286/g.5254  ORF Transcript_1286/g.5254 Transcript_1286/m.5254 type:complete len:104 (+) Transcript_1286:3401-3712(+)
MRGRRRRMSRPVGSRRMRSRMRRSAYHPVVSPTAPTRSARWGKATAPTPAATDRSDFCSIVSGLCPGYSSRVDDDDDAWDDDAWDDEADVEVLEPSERSPSWT